MKNYVFWLYESHVNDETNEKQQAKPQRAQNAVHKLTCGETDFTPFMSKQSSNSVIWIVEGMLIAETCALSKAHLVK